MRPATNRLLKKQFSYEKSNHIWFGIFHSRLDAGLLFQRA